MKDVLYILSYLYWPQGHGTGYLLFNLLKSLLLLRTAHKIMLLPHHLIKGAYNEAVVWNMHSPKAHYALKRRCLSLASGWRNSSDFVSHICWDVMMPILTLYA